MVDERVGDNIASCFAENRRSAAAVRDSAVSAIIFVQIKVESRVMGDKAKNKVPSPLSYLSQAIQGIRKEQKHVDKKALAEKRDSLIDVDEDEESKNPFVSVAFKVFPAFDDPLNGSAVVGAVKARVEMLSLQCFLLLLLRAINQSVCRRGWQWQ